MKLHCFRFLVSITCFFLIQHSTLAQDKGFKMHAVSIAPGIASSSSATAKTGSSLNFDISASIDKHLISFYFNVGLDLNKGGPAEKFTEFSFTYGRKWSLTQHLVLEGHAGVGLFTYDIDDGLTPIFFDFPDSTVGFPIRAKLLYYPGEKFGIGLNPNLNLNSLENAYSLNLVFQYHFH